MECNFYQKEGFKFWDVPKNKYILPCFEAYTNSLRLGYDDEKYKKTWLKSLSINKPKEEWQFRIIQSQFIDFETKMLKVDFIAKHVGLPTTGISEETRLQIIKAASSILVENGYAPKISLFWCSAIGDTQ